MCENKTIVMKTNNMCKKFIMIYMLKQLMAKQLGCNVKSNKIFVLQTVGKDTFLPRMCTADRPPHRHTSTHSWQEAASNLSLHSYVLFKSVFHTNTKKRRDLKKKYTSRDKTEKMQDFNREVTGDTTVTNSYAKIQNDLKTQL